jgi:hypothetical protein
MTSASPWAWRQGRNPYRSTPLQVLALPPRLPSSAAYRAHLRQRRTRIVNAPQKYPLFGALLTEADLNDAAERIKDPEGRLLAELCAHRPRAVRVDLGEARGLLATVQSPIPDLPMNLDPARLRRLVPPIEARTFPSLLPW